MRLNVASVLALVLALNLHLRSSSFLEFLHHCVVTRFYLPLLAGEGRQAVFLLKSLLVLEVHVGLGIPHTEF